MALIPAPAPAPAPVVAPPNKAVGTFAFTLLPNWKPADLTKDAILISRQDRATKIVRRNAHSGICMS